MHKIFNLRNVLNVLYILAIIASLLVIPYHNIRTGFTNWSIGISLGAKGPVNVAALAVQRALTLALIVFYVYNLRLKRKIRDESIEIDMAIKESEDRRHRVEKEYFKLKKQMQNIFDSMDDFVYICSKEFKVEFMNRALKKAFGEGVGKKCYEILYRRKENCPWCFGKRVFEGEFISWEHKHEINNRIYRIYYSPLINPDGSVSKVAVMHDITKEKELQQVLESSEQYFRNLFENLPIACFGYDKDGKFVSWNKRAGELYGYKKEDILGHSMYDTIVQEKDIDLTKNVINEVFKGNAFYGLQWEDKTADGSLRYVYGNTYPLHDLEGKIIMGVAAAIDITAQKKIEQELKNSKEHLEKIMETPNTMIVELDTELNIKRFNRGCEDVTGYSRNEVLGKNWIDLFIPQRLKDIISQAVGDFKKDNGTLLNQYENPILTKSGKERVIFWSITNLKDEKNDIISIIAIGEDITERKKAQQDIIDAEEKYRAFIDSVPIHVGLIDETGKYIIWNKYSEDFLGYTKQEAVGKLTPGIFHETEQEAQEVIDIATREGIFDKELNLVHRDGRRIAARLVVIPRKINGKLIGFCGFAVDISKRKKAERDLLATKEKLESLALKDILTELYNNRYITERLISEFERVKRSLSSLSLLLIDLDYFKLINDKYGREFGDKVLIQVAQLLKSELRVNDVVARWSGEEFMVILVDISRENAILVAEKIQKVFKTKGFGDERNIVNLTCSIGIVSYPEDPLFNPKEMIDAVEKSVFKVKASGGNGVGSYIHGLIKDEVSKIMVTEKERLIDSLKKKMSFFATKGEGSILEAIYSLSKSLELKDHTTRTHAEKTIHYAVKLAQKFGMSEKEIEDVRRAAILHDVGKLGIPDKILFKKGALTKEEFKVIKQHSKIAADIMSVADFLKSSVPYVLYHHERFDGKGYPEGLKGENIPLGARIISVVDVYEALTSVRPYHKAMSKEEAQEIIKNNAGTQFDPSVVNAFLEIIKRESG